MKIEFQSPLRFTKTGARVNTSEKAYTDGSAPDGWSHLDRYLAQFPDDGLQVSDYRDMMQKDGQIASAVNLKIMARLSSGWEVKPASDDPEDRKIAQFVEDQFDGIEGSFYRFLYRAMLSMAYGHSIHEIVLNPIESGEWKGMIGVRALKWKRPEQMRVSTDPYGNVISVDQLVKGNWTPLPHQYFCYHAWDHEGDFVGKSQLRAAYRWYKAKQIIDTFWSIYLEKYAMPTPIGKHPPGMSEVDRQEMLSFITGINGRKGAVFPKNWEVEFLEAMRSGGSAGYKEKIAYCDRMEARALQIPTLLFDEGESGAYALGQQHAANFAWVLENLGSEFADGMVQDQLIKFLVDLNFDTDNYPVFKFRPFEKVKLTELAESFSKLIDKGVVSRDESFLRERMDLPPLEEGATPPEPLGVSPAAPPSVVDDDADDPDAMNRPEKRKPEGSPKAVEATASDDPLDMVEFAAASSDAVRDKFLYQEVGQRLTEREREASASLVSVVEEMKGALLRQMRAKKLIARRDVKGVESLRIPGAQVKEFRNVMEQLFGDALHMGAQDALDEIRRGGFDGDVPKTMGFNLSGDVPEGNEFSQQDIIDFWQSKVPIQRELLSVYSREAFTISGVFRDDILEGAQRTISRGIRRGASAAQIEADLEAFFRPYIGAGASMLLADPYRIETIVRTNLSEAYNTGRMNLFRHPSVRPYVVAFEYSAVLDRNTTPFCREWHGTVLRADDPRVPLNTPPNHFRCRSVWVPIMRGETFTLTEEGGVSSRLPQDGFLGCALDRAEKE